MNRDRRSGARSRLGSTPRPSSDRRARASARRRTWRAVWGGERMSAQPAALPRWRDDRRLRLRRIPPAPTPLGLRASPMDGGSSSRSAAPRRTAEDAQLTLGARPHGRPTPAAPDAFGPRRERGRLRADGSILFTSSRPDADRPPDDAGDDEVSGLWLLPAGGGEARLLVAPSGGVDAVVSARTADVVVYAASVFPGTTDASADRERHGRGRRPASRRSCSRRFRFATGMPSTDPVSATSSRRRCRTTRAASSDPVDLTPEAGTRWSSRTST